MYLVGMPSSVFALLKQNSDTENTCADYSPLEYCAQVFPVSEILYKLPCPYHGEGGAVYQKLYANPIPSTSLN